MRKLRHKSIYFVPFSKQKMHSKLIKFLEMTGRRVSELSQSQDRNWRNFCNSVPGHWGAPEEEEAASIHR